MRGRRCACYILLATIPALLIAAAYLAPRLEIGAISSVDTITVVEGSSLANPTAAKAGAGAATSFVIDGKPHKEWLDEQIAKLAHRLESQIDKKVTNILEELKVGPKLPKSSEAEDIPFPPVEDHTELEKLAAEKVEKALGKIEKKLNLNLDIEKRIAGRLEGKMSDKFDKDLDSKFATTAEQWGLRVITPALAKLLAESGSDKAETPSNQVERVAQAEQPATATPTQRLSIAAQAKKSPAQIDAGPVTQEQIIRQPATECKASEVEAAPKDYCGRKSSGRGSNCLTAHEEEYLKKNWASLQKGMQALRAPGCFPHGVSVATLGYFRTGSTLLYNVARLWAALAAGKSLVSGYGCKSPGAMGIGVEGSDQEHCSLVCKDHEWRAGLAKEATVVLMSRRDPWESVCSRRLMDLWCRLRQKGRKKQASQEEKAEYKEECLRNHTMEALESQYQCKDLMLMQANIYLGRRQQGKAIAYDVLLSDYQTSAAAQVRNIGKAMGVCQEATEDPALVELIVAMGTYLHDSPAQDMGITQMHDVHTDTQRQEKCSKLREWMRQDDECREWMDSDASAESNAVLRQLEAEALQNPQKKNKKS